MSELVAIERECMSCHGVTVLTVTGAGFRAWDMGRGAHIQAAFPELPSADRELLRIGICGSCFDALMPPDPDAETDPGARVVVHLGHTPSDMANDLADALRAAVGESQPGRTDGITATPAECVERARLGLTAEGEPATRGHIHVSDPHWPRCSTEIPGLDSIVWSVQPNICNRPATLMMTFTHEYVESMVDHHCDDPECPIAEIGRSDDMIEELQHKQIPVCGMHLAALHRTERSFLRDVGARLGLTKIFDLAVIGVESTSLLNGHPEASIIDLRPMGNP
jgi:hypothetical protein